MELTMIGSNPATSETHESNWCSSQNIEQKTILKHNIHLNLSQNTKIDKKYTQKTHDFTCEICLPLVLDIKRKIENT